MHITFIFQTQNQILRSRANTLSNLLCYTYQLLFTKIRNAQGMYRILFISLLFFTACTSQPAVSSKKTYHGAPYSLESIDYDYRQKGLNG